MTSRIGGSIAVSQLLVAAAAIVAACNRSGTSATLRSTGRDTAAASGMTLGIDTVARGLEVPWSMAFAPDGRIFVTERVGRIRVIENGGLRAEPWATLPVSAQGEAGLMGIALAPNFTTSRELYIVGTFARGNALVNRVIRLTDDGRRGVRPTVILDNIPAAVFHAGDAIAFGPDGFLYVATGQAFATDHGPSGFPNERFRRDRDELNVVNRDGNLGWPSVSGSAADRRFTPPLVEWSSPGVAPSGAAFYTGPVPEWRGSVFVAALKGEQLCRVVVARDSASPAGWRAVSDEPMFVKTFGRLRAVAMGPDGLLYFTTSNRDGRGVPRPGDDLLLRIRPQ